MIAVDSNVLLRLVVEDDERQNRAAAKFFAARSKDDPAYVSEVVLAEFVWVLRSRYRYSREAIVASLVQLLDAEDLRFAQADAVRQAVLAHSKADISDLLIANLAAAAGCDRVATFDRRAARAVETMELIR